MSEYRKMSAKMAALCMLGTLVLYWFIRPR